MNFCRRYLSEKSFLGGPFASVSLLSLGIIMENGKGVRFVSSHLSQMALSRGRRRGDERPTALLRESIKPLLREYINYPPSSC